jgi:hypothetical protein
MKLRRIYMVLLGLYPRDYVASFGAEMLSTSEMLAEEHRGRGRAAFVRFAMAELIGLIVGAAVEWMAKFRTNRSVAGACVDRSGRSMPDEVLESQRRIAFLIKGMEHAIANHDFPRARNYSYQERQEREKLRLLREKEREGGQT